MQWHDQVSSWADDRYPRSRAYNIDWMMDNMMGPNALWLMESLTERLHLEPGMRVPDMGCGKAISSIFLAKEFGVQVWATDLWIGAGENWDRIKQAGVQDRVYPIHAESHDLPFATGFFDAMVSVDAYHYFGTDDLYFEYYAGFARPGAELGIVVPGIAEEFLGEPTGTPAPGLARRVLQLPQSVVVARALAPKRTGGGPCVGLHRGRMEGLAALGRKRTRGRKGARGGSRADPRVLQAGGEHHLKQPRIEWGESAV